MHESGSATADRASCTPRGDWLVVPLAEAVGAEVRGVDLAAIDDASAAFVQQALNEHSVVVFRDQDLAPAAQIALTRRLGQLLPFFQPQYTLPDYPEILIISNVKRNGVAIGIEDAGMLWHTDASFMGEPEMYSLLYAVEIPHRNGHAIGDTVFCSAIRAYAALPGEMRARLGGLRAVHSFSHHIDKKRRLGNLKRAPLTPEQKAALPDVEHPVVRKHPITGRPGLYVSEGHTSHVVGLSEVDSRSLLDELWAHLRNPAFHYRHHWRVGDCVIWDNAALQHLAVHDYGDLPRRLNRTGTVGTRPFGFDA